jgi:hypothetical protein
MAYQWKFGFSTWQLLHEKLWFNLRIKTWCFHERHKWGKQTTQPIDQVSNMIFHWFHPWIGAYQVCDSVWFGKRSCWMDLHCSILRTSRTVPAIRQTSTLVSEHRRVYRLSWRPATGEPTKYIILYIPIDYWTNYCWMLQIWRVLRVINSSVSHISLINWWYQASKIGASQWLPLGKPHHPLLASCRRPGTPSCGCTCRVSYAKFINMAHLLRGSTWWFNDQSTQLKMLLRFSMVIFHTGVFHS